MFIIFKALVKNSVNLNKLINLFLYNITQNFQCSVRNFTRLSNSLS